MLGSFNSIKTEREFCQNDESDVYDERCLSLVGEMFVCWRGKTEMRYFCLCFGSDYNC